MSGTIILVFCLLLFLDLMLVAIRTSLVEARLPRLVELRSQKVKEIEHVINTLERPLLPVTLRSMVTLLEMLLAGLFWYGLQRIIPDALASALVVVLTLLAGGLILCLEYIVERLVMINREAWAIRLSPLARLIDQFSYPLSWLLVQLRGKSVKLERRMDSVTEEELRHWVDVDQSEVTLEKGERKMIYSIFHFSDTVCREIMVPRIYVFALDVNTPLREAISEIVKSNHSRVPLYEDTIDNICGVLYAKDLLKVQQDDTVTTIRSLMRPAYFVPEGKKVDELLREIKDSQVHIVIVVDEYGGVAGIVTLEDVMEEIVGEIRDEYDQSEENPCQQVNPDEFIFQGRIDLDDLNEVLDTHITRELADTLGGFIYSEIGRVPVGGEQVRVEDWDLVVTQVSGRRILRVRATRRPVKIKEEVERNDVE